MPGIVLLVFLLLTATHAHESCCEAKRREMEALKERPFITDASATPPDIFEGEARMIPDPDDDEPPANWDEEEDGEWQPNLIENPAYTWVPPMVANPKYSPPRSLLSKLRGEVFEALPWVTLGVLITATLDAVQLPLHAIQTRLGRGSLVGAGLIGLATPLCSCGSLPVARGFAAAGVPLGSVVAFLTATQSSGIDSLAVTWGLLGRTAALCRLLGSLLLAVAAGFAVGLGDQRRSEPAALGATRKGSGGAHASELPQPGTARGGVVAGLRKGVGTAVGVAGDVFPMVGLGLLLSTAAVHYLPALLRPYESLVAADPPHHHRGGSDGMDMSMGMGMGDGLGDGVGMGSRGGTSPAALLARVLVLAAALPLQVCEHTSVTIAAGVQKAGGSPGLAFAFLLAAPATNLASLFVLARPRGTEGDAASGSEGRRASRLVVLRVALALVVAPLALSLAVDGARLDLLVQKEAEVAGSMPALPWWYASLSPWLAGALASAALLRAVRARLGSSKRGQAEGHDKCCGATEGAGREEGSAPKSELRRSARKAKKVD